MPWINILSKAEPRRQRCCCRDEDAAALGFAVGSETEGAITAAAPVAISCWRGRGNLNVLVSKQECSQIAAQVREARAALRAAQQAGQAAEAAVEAAAEEAAAEEAAAEGAAAVMGEAA